MTPDSLIAANTGGVNYPGVMTQAQFRALAVHLDHARLVHQVPQCGLWIQSTRGQLAEVATIARWLRNGWNTERILRLSSRLLHAREAPAALHWCFPQAYYSVFTIVLAFFHARGFTETTHRSVMERFGRMASEGKYPDVMAFCVGGSREAIEYRNIKKPTGLHSIAFDEDDPDTVHNQICQFLKSTHENALEARRQDMRKKFRTILGKQKKRLTSDEWSSIADSCGWTSLLALLYRKRIKANYGEIDTFMADDVDASAIHQDLVHIVSSANFVHEALIARAIGLATYVGIVEGFQTGGSVAFLERRTRFVRRLFS